MEEEVHEYRGYPDPIIQMLDAASCRLLRDGRSDAHLLQARSNVELQLRLASKSKQFSPTLLICGDLDDSHAIGHVTQRRSLSVLSIYVAPKLRGRGSGRQMVETMTCHAARVHRCKRCTVTLQSCLSDARGFWINLGFSMSGGSTGALIDSAATGTWA